MKIAHIMRQYYPTIGGIQNVVAHLAKEFIETGHEIEVIALNRLFDKGKTCLDDAEIVDNIQVYRVPYWGSKRYPISPTILRHLRNYDLIHLHSSDFFLDYLALTKFLYDAPLIFSSHGLFFHTSFAKNLKTLYFKTITRLSLKNVTTIVCDSKQDYKLLTSIAPLHKLTHIPNGVKYELFSSFPIENKDPNLLISIGNLTANKRQDKLIEVFAHLTKLNPKAVLVIIGADKGRLSFLKELSLKLGIQNKVKFTGKISDQDLFKYLSKASIFLSASSYEGFGIALLESMASGCLPIVQANPAHHELVQNDLFLANFDDHIQATQKIQSIMSLSLEAKAKLIKTLRANTTYYSWENIASQYMQIYTDAGVNSR